MTRSILGLLAAAMLVAAAAPPAAQAAATPRSLRPPSKKRSGSEAVTYTVTVTNLGPDVTTGAVFGDPIPDQLNLVASTCGAISAFCAVETLPSGASATPTILATPIPNLEQGERLITNPAFVAQPTTIDPNLSKDQASATVRVFGRLPG